MDRAKNAFKLHLENNPKETAHTPHSGGFVCMHKSAFDTPERGLNTIAFEPAILNDRGYVALQYVTAGVAMDPLLPHVMVPQDGGTASSSAADADDDEVEIKPSNDHFKWRAIVLSGGRHLDPCAEEKENIPAVQRLLETSAKLYRHKLPEDVLATYYGASARLDMNADSSKFTTTVMERYFPAIEKDSRGDYVVYVFGTTGVFVEMARAPDRRDPGSSSSSSSSRGGSESKIYLGEKTIEMPLDNARLNRSAPAALFRPMYLDQIYVNAGKYKPRLAGSAIPARYLREFCENFPDKLTETFPGGKNAKWIASVAAGMVLQDNPTPMPLVPKPGKLADCSERHLQVRLETTRSLEIAASDNARLCERRNVRKARYAGIADAAALSGPASVSPAHTYSYRNDGTNIADTERGPGMNRTYFPNTARACLLMSVANYKANVDGNAVDEEIAEDVAGGDALIRLVAAMDLKECPTNADDFVSCREIFEAKAPDSMPANKFKQNRLMMATPKAAEHLAFPFLFLMAHQGDVYGLANLFRYVDKQIAPADGLVHFLGEPKRGTFCPNCDRIFHGDATNYCLCYFLLAAHVAASTAAKNLEKPLEVVEDPNPAAGGGSGGRRRMRRIALKSYSALETSYKKISVPCNDNLRFDLRRLHYLSYALTSMLRDNEQGSQVGPVAGQRLAHKSGKAAFGRAADAVMNEIREKDGGSGNTNTGGGGGGGVGGMGGGGAAAAAGGGGSSGGLEDGENLRKYSETLDLHKLIETVAGNIGPTFPKEWIAEPSPGNPLLESTVLGKIPRQTVDLSNALLTQLLHDPYARAPYTVTALTKDAPVKLFEIQPGKKNRAHGFVAIDEEDEDEDDYDDNNNNGGGGGSGGDNDEEEEEEEGEGRRPRKRKASRGAILYDDRPKSKKRRKRRQNGHANGDVIPEARKTAMAVLIHIATVGDEPGAANIAEEHARVLNGPDRVTTLWYAMQRIGTGSPSVLAVCKSKNPEYFNESVTPGKSLRQQLTKTLLTYLVEVFGKIQRAVMVALDYGDDFEKFDSDRKTEICLRSPKYGSAGGGPRLFVDPKSTRTALQRKHESMFAVIFSTSRTMQHEDDGGAAPLELSRSKTFDRLTKKNQPSSEVIKTYVKPVFVLSDGTCVESEHAIGTNKPFLAHFNVRMRTEGICGEGKDIDDERYRKPQAGGGGMEHTQALQNGLARIAEKPESSVFDLLEPNKEQLRHPAILAAELFKSPVDWSDSETIDRTVDQDDYSYSGKDCNDDDADNDDDDVLRILASVERDTRENVVYPILVNWLKKYIDDIQSRVGELLHKSVRFLKPDWIRRGPMKLVRYDTKRDVAAVLTAYPRVKAALRHFIAAAQVYGHAGAPFQESVVLDYEWTAQLVRVALLFILKLYIGEKDCNKTRDELPESARQRKPMCVRTTLLCQHGREMAVFTTHEQIALAVQSIGICKYNIASYSGAKGSDELFTFAKMDRSYGKDSAEAGLTQLSLFMPSDSLPLVKAPSVMFARAGARGDVLPPEHLFESVGIQVLGEMLARSQNLTKSIARHFCQEVGVEYADAQPPNMMDRSRFTEIIGADLFHAHGDPKNVAFQLDQFVWPHILPLLYSDFEEAAEEEKEEEDNGRVMNVDIL